jgi:hypothetical protein
MHSDERGAAFYRWLRPMENSPAVIIRRADRYAMVNPGIAMALAEGRPALAGRALVAEVVGAICVLAIGCVIGLSTRHLVVGSEILNRTAPNLLDLLIALVGGLAGGFAFLSLSLSSVIVGVAIATALVPPLTTGGILLARGLPGAAMGAFLLFLANFSAIAFRDDCLSAGRISPGAAEKIYIRAEVSFCCVAARSGNPSVRYAAAYQRTGSTTVIVPRFLSVALLLALAIHLFRAAAYQRTGSTAEHCPEGPS